jgi:hypothetical protein
MPSRQRNQTSKAAEATDERVQKVMQETAKLAQRTEELHDTVKRTEALHHSVECSLEQAEQKRRPSKARKP